MFHVAPQTSSRSSKSAPWKAQNDPQEAPRSRPGRPRRGPRDFKTAPRAAKSAPRAPPEPPKHGPERPWRRSWAQLAQQSRPEASRRPFWTLHGSLLHLPGVELRKNVLLSESIAKAVLWAKLAQAYAQNRFTSLCNFYICISTATDSRSSNI